MSYDVDEEILQDFLIEAGEILDLLQGQLVTLESDPENAELLNAIFRGYHTVKGGAGFLALTELVEVCHGAENVFDVMRNHQRTLTPELMDVILKATDQVVEMFESVKQREPLQPAPAELIDLLHKLSQPEQPGEDIFGTQSDESSVDQEHEFEDEGNDDDEEDEYDVIAQSLDKLAQEIIDETKADVERYHSYELDDEFEAALQQVIDDQQQASPASSSDSIDDITEDEFEALLSELHGSSDKAASTAIADSQQKHTAVNTSNNNDITDDEFEALLDDLHGVGSFSAASPQSAASATPNNEGAGTAGGDEITDDEFEALLDKLHGEGKAPTEVATQANTTQSTSPTESINAAATGQKAAKPASTSGSGKSSPKVSTPSSSSTASRASATPAKSASSAAVNTPAKAKEVTAKAKPDNKPAPTETTVRVDTRRLDQIMNMVGELVLVRNRLVLLGVEANESMSKAIANLDIVTGDLQGAVMQTRMQPIKKVFGRFPRVVRDLARTLKKEIELKMIGEETDLDKNLVEALADPLVHLVRNSVDHGIELPAEREAAGKARMGTVTLSAAQQGDHILLTIEDDGKGMDPEKLKGIAVKRGVLDPDAAARLTDVEAFNLIFAPGFSTKQEISDISGRGVGMDVVKTKINQLNGSVNINSKMGVGTTIEIKVPLTLAILPTLMIVVGEKTFALPLGSVSEILSIDTKRMNTVDGQLTMIVRNKAIPLFYLNQWLSPGTAFDRKQGHVVVVQHGTKQIGFVVDALIGQEEVVIKPLDRLLQGTPGIAGATITSDGGIALILDVPSLIKRYA